MTLRGVDMGIFLEQVSGTVFTIHREKRNRLLS